MVDFYGRLCRSDEGDELIYWDHQFMVNGFNQQEEKKSVQDKIDFGINWNNVENKSIKKWLVSTKIIAK